MVSCGTDELDVRVQEESPVAAVEQTESEETVEPALPESVFDLNECIFFSFS